MDRHEWACIVLIVSLVTLLGLVHAALVETFHHGVHQTGVGSLHKYYFRHVKR